MKYSDGEPVSLEIYAAEENLIIRVVNTGKGISKEDMAQIFNRFSVLDNYGKQNGWKNNGLGLAITARMVKLLSGTIRVDSIPDDTDRFYCQPTDPADRHPSNFNI